MSLGSVRREPKKPYSLIETPQKVASMATLVELFLHKYSSPYCTVILTVLAFAQQFVWYIL